MSLKTYTGSCHCQRVKFEADIDLAAGTGRCNCSICTKSRNWNATIKPEAFRLLSGEDSLHRYQFNTHSIEHLFCMHCGVKSFGYGDIPEIGGKFVSVSVACLDDASPDELLSGPLTYFNGRDNKWLEVPAETRHL